MHASLGNPIKRPTSAQIISLRPHQRKSFLCNIRQRLRTTESRAVIPARLRSRTSGTHRYGETYLRARRVVLPRTDLW